MEGQGRGGWTKVTVLALVGRAEQRDNSRTARNLALGMRRRRELVAQHRTLDRGMRNAVGAAMCPAHPLPQNEQCNRSGRGRDRCGCTARFAAVDAPDTWRLLRRCASLDQGCGVALQAPAGAACRERDFGRCASCLVVPRGRRARARSPSSTRRAPAPRSCAAARAAFPRPGRCCGRAARGLYGHALGTPGHDGGELRHQFADAVRASLYAPGL